MLRLIAIARLAAIAAACAVTASCTSLNRLGTDKAIDAARDSVVVLGVSPPNHRIQLFAGDVKDGVWHQHLLGVASFFGAAENGYVLTKVGSDKTLAIALIVIVADEKKILGDMYTPCGDARTVVFKVPPGKVLYLSDFEFAQEGNRLVFKFGPDLARARSFVDANYPSLEGRLEQGAFELMPTSTACGTGTVYVPIFIPR